jgi:hypothetical protein
MHPVPGPSWPGGASDQRKTEERPDVLVYSSEALTQGLEVSGPIEVTLYVSSDVKDTDVTVKVLDVSPDGVAYNLDQTIQRLRWREGYEHSPVWVEPGKVYKATLQPMQTSNYFAPGHRIRLEVSSSDFPRFDRNLNTGGDNYDETRGGCPYSNSSFQGIPFSDRAFSRKARVNILRWTGGLSQHWPAHDCVLRAW